MAKKVSNYRHKIKFYKPTGEFELNEGGILVPKFELYKSLHGRKEDIIRENLESLISGANHVKKRTRLKIRYREDITEDMHFFIDNFWYAVKVVGDREGLRNEMQVIGEAIVDGGVGVKGT